MCALPVPTAQVCGRCLKHPPAFDATAARLMQKCMSGSGSEAVQACQSAANIGSLMQVQETAALNQQVAESVRLQALDLARENAIEKRTQQETNERQKQLEAATRGMAPPQIQFIGGEGSLR